MYSKEFYNELDTLEKEYYENKLFLETIHPIDLINNKDQVLIEAAEKAEGMGKTIKSMQEFIKKAIDKFMIITNKLLTDNAKLIEKYKAIKPNEIQVGENFSYGILPYWDGVRNIMAYSTPDYRNEDIALLSSNNGKNYKDEKFSNFNGLFDENGSVNSAYFKGGVENIKVNKNNAAAVFKDCLNIIEQRKQISDKIVAETSKINRLRVDASVDLKTIGESALFDMSIFKDEYTELLYESMIAPLFEDSNGDGITTTSDIEREEKSGVEINKEENTKINDAKQAMEAAKNWSKICYDITAKMMSALDEAYDRSIRYCEKFSKQ